MPLYELAALGAALCWAITGILSATAAAHLGAIAFNRLRMSLVFVMLLGFVLVMRRWSVGMEHVAPLILSGLIGIFVGDNALFLALNRLGPRRTGILFALNAPFSVILGWLWLGEALAPRALVGILVTFTGVVLAIAFRRSGPSHHWEEVKGPLWIGVGLGLAAALAQALGSLIARPVMAAGVDPASASTLRIGTAALCLTLLTLLPARALKPANPLNARIVGIVALSGFLAMAVGMTLLLYALSGGEVGVVATLSATTPAILLPLLWWKTGEPPAAAAWAGAGLVIAGTALIFTA